MTFHATMVLLSTLLVAGCVGPVSLHKAVLGYDETTSRLDRDMLLLNIARTHHNLPTHFTLTASIAATFDYRTNAGFIADILENPGSDNAYELSVGASAAENPTLSIVPVQGEEFTKRILAPMDESKFEFLVFQGAPIDMVLRLMADGIEVQDDDGTFQKFIQNWPTARDEYEEFRKRAIHLAWLNDNRKLFVARISLRQSVRLAGAPSPGDVNGLMAALDKGFTLRQLDGALAYELERTVRGRVAITNYDPRTLSDAELQMLNDRAARNPGNFVLVDVRPEHPGGDFPLFGAIKLRSLNRILTFLAAGISRVPEYHVEKDVRTGSVRRNPVRTLDVIETEDPPADTTLSVSYGGKHYSVRPTPWDRDAFGLLYKLFQMAVTDVSRIGVPVTISK